MTGVNLADFTTYDLQRPVMRLERSLERDLLAALGLLPAEQEPVDSNGGAMD